MPYITTKAFILGVSPLKEQDKLVHLLTYDHGILKAMAPGSCKVRNRFGSLLELFTETEFVYYQREERDMVILSKGDLVNSYFNIVSQPENIFYFYLVAEILLKFVPFEHEDKRIYRLVHALLEQRSAGIPIELLLIYFMIWILRIEGMMFNSTTCQNCNRKDLKTAWVRDDFRGILCPNCRTNESLILNLPDLNFITWTEKHSPKELTTWEKKIDSAHLIRLFKQKIENHGEIVLKSAIYLSQFR